MLCSQIPFSQEVQWGVTFLKSLAGQAGLCEASNQGGADAVPGWCHCRELLNAGAGGERQAQEGSTSTVRLGWNGKRKDLLTYCWGCWKGSLLGQCPDHPCLSRLRQIQLRAVISLPSQRPRQVSGTCPMPLNVPVPVESAPCCLSTGSPGHRNLTGHLAMAGDTSLPCNPEHAWAPSAGHPPCPQDAAGLAHAPCHKRFWLCQHPQELVAPFLWLRGPWEMGQSSRVSPQTC